MVVYLINKETNEIIQVFENVIKWDNNFVEHGNGNYRAKIYCNANEYFTDIATEKKIEDESTVIE